MGAAGSSNSIPPPPSPPPCTSSSPLRGRTEETSNFICGTGEPYCSEYTNENIRQRTRTSAFDTNEEPRSQGPSPYATLREDEWWNQRPSAPSLSNLRPPRRETLLTYATQMTGWQTAEGHNPSFSHHHQQHQEAMELSRIISQLAMANQQLASAHNVTLAHLETLYVELRKERESRRRGVPSMDVEALDEALKKRLTGENVEDDDETEERQRLELRLDRLESMLAENMVNRQTRQRNQRREEERRLRLRIERLESLVNAQEILEEDIRRNDERVNNTEVCSRVNNDRYVEKQNDLTRIELRSSDPAVQPTVNVSCDKISNRNDVPECELKYHSSTSQIKTMDDEGRQKSIHRPRNTYADDEQANISRINDETIPSNTDLHLETARNERTKVKDQQSQVESAAYNEIIRLSEEVARLKAERLEYSDTNERLLNNLAEQKIVIERLTKDYQESKARYEEVESRLNMRKEEYDQLMNKFDIAKKETERLLKEIDAFNVEKDTAEARISTLEQELQKSLLEKEEIKNTESQKTLKLRAQLSEEIMDKKKQIKALEDALDEIQRLKETIKTDRKNSDDDTSKEDVGPIESIDETQDGPPTDRASSIDEFKKELTLKREARQRAIAAVSSEMERLRRELDAEKEAHSETSRVLDLLRSAQGGSSAQSTSNTGTEGNFRKSRVKDQKPDEHELALKRVEAQRLTSILKVSDELRNDVRFQMEKVDDLRYQLETEPEQHRYRIRCLTEVTNKTREGLCARERRANELKDHLAQILVRLGDRSFLEVKDDVGAECERQLENINSLKSLYNERLKVLTELKEAAVKELADVKEKLDHSLKKSECLEDDLKKADEKIDAQDTEISNLESQLGLTKADCRDLQNQMSLINGLFTQMLLGASSADMDLDRLTQLLQENHDLISDMTREEGTEAAALPKLLLDLIEQVEGSKGTQKRSNGENNSPSEGEVEKKEDDLQEEDIAHNLPKVWRVLLELLSCYAVGTPSASVASSSDPNSCYKSVDTPAGPRLVISVSKTYIRLKELILEKKHLEKEMNRMKQLNAHLESKLGEQEKRLSAVSAELSKTWNIVGRMQAQHQQLHTHEKILRYELQQKRKMLQELKQELEYCREKWESARQKNTNTELEWRSLRREFAARKALAVHDSFNNSAESGFSDERGDDTDEEEDAVEERIRLGPRRRTRKESPRAPTPDTESEQPTDTELSDPKTSSSTTLEQRTPTPETEAELDEIEIADVNLNAESASPIEGIQLIPEGTQEALDPLDQALTNVIQNLIIIDESAESERQEPLKDNAEITKAVVTSNNSHEKSPEPDLTSCTLKEESVKSRESNTSSASSVWSRSSIDVSGEEENASAIVEDSHETLDTDGERTKTEESPKFCVSHVPSVTTTTTTSTMSVFSIGPFPQPTVTPSSVKSVQFSDPLIVGPSNRFFAPVFGTSTIDYEETVDNNSSSSSSISLSRKSPEVEANGLGEKRASRSMESIVDSDNVSVDSTSSLETVKEFSTVEHTIEPIVEPSSSTSISVSEEEKKKSATNSSDPSPSSSSTKQEEASNATVVKTRTPEEALAAREDRLKRLEEQAEWLMKKMNATSRRSSALSTRLEELHEVYGEPPVPPPMPDVLPTRRLRTNLNELPRQVPESSSTEDSENITKPVSRRRSGESPSNNAP